MLKNKNLSKQKLFLVLAAVVILCAGTLVYLRKTHDSQAGQQAAGTESNINFDPPTEQDKQRVEDNKQLNVARDEAIKNQPTQQTGSKKSVIPSITYAGQYGNTIEVGGYVTGVFEEGGTCTATFSQNSSSFSKTSTGVKNVNSVDCPTISVNKNEFSQIGSWTVTLSYESAQASGKSEPRQIEVK